MSKYNFKGKKFKYVEFVKGYLGNRGNFSTLSEVEKYIWNNDVDKTEIWKSIYSYYDINNREVSYAPFYFESDIENFETNRKVILYMVNYLHYVLEIPLEAFKFKLSKKSIWVEITPQVFDITPTHNLNLIFKSMIIELNKIVVNGLGIINPLDLSVYKDRQLTRLLGSYLKGSKRYVIDITYNELLTYSKKDLFRMAKYKRKLTYPSNNDFFKCELAKDFFNRHKRIIQQKSNKDNPFIINKDYERVCVNNIEKEGVEKGFRNIALFYSSINAKEKNISKENWLNYIFAFMRNFNKEDIDSYSQIKATINSAYNKNYKFSCNTIKTFIDTSICENCKFKNLCNSNSVKIYKNQLKAISNESYSTVRLFFKSLNNKKLTNTEQKKINDLDLKNYNLLKGSYITIPFSTLDKIENLNSEILLFIRYLISSNNNLTINPRKKLNSYANDLNKSLRTIQRFHQTLEKKELVSKNKLLLVENIDKKSNKDDENIKIIKLPLEKSIIKNDNKKIV